MSFTKWHRDTAAESIKRHEKDYGARADYWFAQVAITAPEVLALVDSLAAELGNQKLADIAKNVRVALVGGNKYKKVTAPQKHVLATALLEKFGTARGIGAAAWELTAAEIEAADA